MSPRDGMLNKYRPPRKDRARKVPNLKDHLEHGQLFGDTGVLCLRCDRQQAFFELTNKEGEELARHIEWTQDIVGHWICPACKTRAEAGR